MSKLAPGVRPSLASWSEDTIAEYVCFASLSCCLLFISLILVINLMPFAHLSFAFLL
jgi:hypothetical protein